MVVQARIPALQKAGGGTYTKDTTWHTLTCVYVIALETGTVTHEMEKYFSKMQESVLLSAHQAPSI